MTIKINLSKIDEYFADFQVMELRRYHATLEKLLKDELKEFKKSVSSEGKKIANPEEREEFYASHSDDYQMLSESFVRTMRNAFLISVFSLIEDQFGTICEKLQKKRNMPFGWRDLRYDILDRGNRYILALTGRAPNTIPVWSKLRFYQKLRNCIVHNDGELQEESVISLARGAGILPTDEDKLFLTEDFCKEVTDNVGVFFKELYVLIR
jgi:hypothetical protein